MQHGFGAGTLYGLVSSGGILVPRKFGALQDVSIDFSFTTKELYGQNQFAIAIGRGNAKVTGKAKNAVLNGGMLNDIFFGGANQTGQTVLALTEAGTVPGTSTYTVTVTNSAHFVDDLGVTNATTGLPFTRVASGPTQGQYSVAAGVYTFAAADANAAVVIDYSYTVTTGNTTTISNQLAGTTPTFVGEFGIRYNGKQCVLRLNALTSSKLTLATKQEDFLIPEFDFSAMADASGTLGTLSLAE